MTRVSVVGAFCFGRTRQRLQPLTGLGTRTPRDLGLESLVVRMDRGTNNPIDAVGGGRFEEKRPAPAFKLLRKLLRVRADGGGFAAFERAMIRERTSAGLAAARAEGRIGGRRKTLDASKRKEIAESVVAGRKSGAEMARLYNIGQPTVSRIVAQHPTTVP